MLDFLILRFHKTFLFSDRLIFLLSTRYHSNMYDFHVQMHRMGVPPLSQALRAASRPVSVCYGFNLKVLYFYCCIVTVTNKK